MRIKHQNEIEMNSMLSDSLKPFRYNNENGGGTTYAYHQILRQPQPRDNCGTREAVLKPEEAPAYHHGVAGGMGEIVDGDGEIVPPIIMPPQYSETHPK